MTTETIHAGTKAPAFSLSDQDGKPVSLKDYQGRWLVLYFYPKDDTPGCTTEAQEFTAAWKRFDELGAAVVGVSPDSPESHREFIAKYHLSLRLLSDPDHQTIGAYGAWGEKMSNGRRSEGVLRSTVLVDPEGRIAYRWTAVKPAGHPDAVAKQLAELGAV